MRRPSSALIFSALDAAAADDLEELFAREGFMVFSNAKSHRMDPDVPILLPYVNAPLLDVVQTQAHYEKSRGGIVTNANCASTGLAVALRPLLDKWGIARLSIATLQAISGEQPAPMNSSTPPARGWRAFPRKALRVCRERKGKGMLRVR